MPECIFSLIRTLYDFQHWSYSRLVDVFDLHYLLSTYRRVCFCIYLLWVSWIFFMVQVNLCQKLSFLNQLSTIWREFVHWTPRKNTSSQHVVYKNCFLLFKTIFVHNMLWCELVFFLEFYEQSLVILWANWCKNEGFWKRFTCKSF